MEYNVPTTRVFFVSPLTGGVGILTPTGELPVEVVATRDLDPGTEYWIVDMKTEEAIDRVILLDEFFDCYEIDRDVLGPPHGVSVGYDEWTRLNPEEPYIPQSTGD